MSFEVAISEVLAMLQNSVETYEEIIRNMEASSSANSNDNLKSKMVERLIELKQQSEELAQHLIQTD
jgi:ElaB/YqjD/DUF883 family membrane-anchored ribosome-binding protein